MIIVSGPTIVRRQLGRRLREARQAAGKTVEDVVTSRIMSKSTLQNTEYGRTPINPGKVLQLCRLYRLDADTTDALYALAEGTHGRGWWEEAPFAFPGFRLYVGLESSAALIQDYQTQLLHGLLQTADYARAVTRISPRAEDEQWVEKVVAFRMKRQAEFFARTPLPRIQAVMHAGVLLQEIGGPEVMAEQLAHLLDLVVSGKADIRVLPWSVGAHAAVSGAFTLMRFGTTDDPTVIYIEAMVGSSYFEEPSQVDRYAQAFDSIWKQAIPLKEHIS